MATAALRVLTVGTGAGRIATIKSADREMSPSLLDPAIEPCGDHCFRTVRAIATAKAARQHGL